MGYTTLLSNDPVFTFQLLVNVVPAMAKDRVVDEAEDPVSIYTAKKNYLFKSKCNKHWQISHMTIVVSIEFSPLSTVELTTNWYQLHNGDYKGILQI